MILRHLSSEKSSGVKTRILTSGSWLLKTQDPEALGRGHSLSGQRLKTPGEEGFRPVCLDEGDFFQPDSLLLASGV